MYFSNILCLVLFGIVILVYSELHKLCTSFLSHHMYHNFHKRKLQIYLILSRITLLSKPPTYLCMSNHLIIIYHLILSLLPPWEVLGDMHYMPPPYIPVGLCTDQVGMSHDHINRNGLGILPSQNVAHSQSYPSPTNS